MSRTYRNRWSYDLTEWYRTKNLQVAFKLNPRGRDESPRSHHRKQTRCMCQYPRDRWHKKRFRRAVQAGATQREAKAARGW